jgi:hypothetical protein
VLVVVALVSIAALTIQEAVATRALFFDTPSREAQRERSLYADLARWTAMGEYYENREQAKRQHSREVDTARWMGQAQYYRNLEESQRVQRGRTADAARWMAMSEYYQKLTGTEAQSLQRGGAEESTDIALDRAPLDQCFDVSLSEVTACHEASQAPSP